MSKSKWFVMFAALVLIVALLAGCGQSGEDGDVDGNQGGNGQGEETNAFPMTFVDDAGRSVEITQEPQRVVSLMPSLTETMFELGLGDRLVGVSDFCNYPTEAQDIEKIGNLFSLNIEKILSLEPDLVLASQSELLGDEIDFMVENGLTVVVIYPQDLDAIEESFRRVGKITGAPDKGIELAAQVRAERDALAARVGSIAQEDKPRVFILLDSDALYTMGDGEFLSDMVELAGGINAASGEGSGYIQLSEEVFFALDPDIIINSWPMKDIIMARDAWQDLQAIQNDRVYDVDGDLVTRPGPRIIQGLEELYSVFYE